MSERAQRQHELLYGKSNPLGLRESDIEVDAPFIVSCDWCGVMMKEGDSEDDRRHNIDGDMVCSPCYESEAI